MVENPQVEMVYVWNLRVCSCSKVMFEVRAYLKEQMFNSLSFEMFSILVFRWFNPFTLLKHDCLKGGKSW